jgi:hypothetical protein
VGDDYLNGGADERSAVASGGVNGYAGVYSGGNHSQIVFVSGEACADSSDTMGGAGGAPSTTMRTLASNAGGSVKYTMPS